MNNKEILILIFGIFLISFISAAQVSYCCEKTNSGSWCINAAQDSCDTNFRAAPTSCESTSYCKLGCCYNSEEGTCMENTPQKVCQDNGGVWDEDSECEIPQCSLGCCLIGNQAAFVTQVRCKRLSSLYGLENNFLTNIDSELACIASATAEVKGACVYEKDYERTCEFLTKQECTELKSTYNNTEFYEDFLCSNEKLGTNCGPTKETTCVDGRDEVYFKDSCGNLANVYDASKINDKNYWNEIVPVSESCGAGTSNANSQTCGNCDYYLGSTCKKYERSEDKSRPKYGENICRDLSCEYKGKTYQHGETWCGQADGLTQITIGDERMTNVASENIPGSRYYRLVCYNNEVTIEPCADYRQEVCKESEVNGFSTAACVVNKWQDCYSQQNKQDCENTEKRDCLWIKGTSILKDDKGNELVLNKNNELVPKGYNDLIKERGEYVKASCVPKYAPGLNLDSNESSELCSIANTQHVIIYEKKLGGDWKCKENCEYVKEVKKGKFEANPAWEKDMNLMCSRIGDCGSKVNILGVKGYESKSVVTLGKQEEDYTSPTKIPTGGTQ